MHCQCIVRLLSFFLPLAGATMRGRKGSGQTGSSAIPCVSPFSCADTRLRGRESTHRVQINPNKLFKTKKANQNLLLRCKRYEGNIHTSGYIDRYKIQNSFVSFLLNIIFYTIYTYVKQEIAIIIRYEMSNRVFFLQK